MEDEYVRLLTLARQRRDAGILSPDDYKAEKTRLAEMQDGWIRSCALHRRAQFSPLKEESWEALRVNKGTRQQPLS